MQMTLALAAVTILLAACMTSMPAGLSGRLPYNEQIMYGDVVQTPAMMEADRKFIDEFAARGVTRRQGSNELVRLGWTYLKKGDMPTAIKRYNQAWLLDPDNYGAYWGFAVVMMDRDHDAVGAERMFRKSMDMVADDVDLLVDYARFLGKERRYRESADAAEKALVLNPYAREAHAVLATSYLSIDFGRALEHAKIARYRGEGVGFAVMPVLNCFLDKGISQMDDPRIRASANACRTRPSKAVEAAETRRGNSPRDVARSVTVE